MATARAQKSTVRPLPRNEPGTRHLRVAPDAPRRLRLTPRAGVVLTLGLFGGLFGVAASHALLIEGQVELDRLDQEVAAEQARYERLRLDVAELESPDRIVAEARDRLGMVPPDDTVWVTPDEPAPEGTAGQASGAADAPEAPETSWSTVKPYLGPTP